MKNLYHLQEQRLSEALCIEMTRTRTKVVEAKVHGMGENVREETEEKIFLILSHSTLRELVDNFHVIT